MNIKKYKNLWRKNEVMRHVSKAVAMYKMGKVDKNGLATFSVPMVSNYWTIGSKNVKNLLHE